MSAPCAIPGDVGTLEQLATRLSGVADETSYAASRLDRLHDGTWLGAAAEKFGERAGQLPPKLHTASDAFRSAESAYRGYAADLSHGQAEASRAVSLWSTGESATATWHAQVDALPAGDPGKAAPDPGGWLRDQASQVYRDAVDMVDASARRAANSLHHAASLAPHGPGFWSQAWHATVSFADGMWDGTVGLVKMAWEFSPIRLMIDPDGWARDASTMGKALYWGATHPVEFAKAIGEDFMKDPAHALGELVPGLLLAAATGGGGLAANAVRTGMERAGTVAGSTAEKLTLRAAQVHQRLRFERPTMLQLPTVGSVSQSTITQVVTRDLVTDIEQATSLTFTRKPDSLFVSPQGVEYTRTTLTAHGHRVNHVLAHTMVNTTKKAHSVFTNGLEAYRAIDDAWAARLASGTLKSQGRVWDIPAGKVVGTHGETYIRIVIKPDTSRLITAHPIHASHARKAG